MNLVIYRTDYNTLRKSIFRIIDMLKCPFKNFAEIDIYCKKLDNKQFFYTWEIL